MGQYSTTCLINYNQISYGIIQTDSFLGGQAREEFLEELEGEEGRDKEMFARRLSSLKGRQI